jgi:hypothetical protein
MEKIVIKKFARRAEHNIELDVFRFDGAVEQRREARIASANEF